MAKNFTSVLDALRAAGEDRLQEVDSVYTLNCDWLLEQFKHSQASLAALRPTVQATANVEEQQVRLYMLWVCLSALLALSSVSDQVQLYTEYCKSTQPAKSPKGQVHNDTGPCAAQPIKRCVNALLRSKPVSACMSAGSTWHDEINHS